MYKILDKQQHNINVVELTDGEFKGCQFIFGGIKFLEDKLEFEYDIVNGFVVPVDKMTIFVTNIGDSLLLMLEESIKNHDTLFVGGTDKNVIFKNIDSDLN